jgi:adenosylhomocysteine nucleosidase
MVWGILGAVEEEVWLVIDNLTQKRESRRNNLVFIEGKLMNQSVVVMATGVGKVRAASSVQYLIDHYPVDRIVFCGVAGAVNPELAQGDIVVGQKTVQHDFDAGGKGLFTEMKTPYFDANPDLVALAVKSIQALGDEKRFRVGTILSGDQTIISSDKKKWLWETFRGDCVEMEGAAVAMVSYRNRVPFVIIRAITDLADENAREDFRQAISTQARRSARVVLGMFEKFDDIKSFKRSFSFRVRRGLLRRIRAFIDISNKGRS